MTDAPPALAAALPLRPTSAELVDLLLRAGAGATRPERPAVATRAVGGWEEWSYAELARRVAGAAAALVGRGVRPGDRVVLAAEAGGPWVAALLGAWRAGAVAVPLDPRLTPAELGPILHRTAPAAVVASGPALPAARQALGAEAAATLVVEVEALVAAAPAPTAALPPRRGADEPALVVWTSGTAGAPKGVTLSYANVAYSVSRAVAVQGPTGADRWLSVLPPHHLLELCCGVLPALAVGAGVCVARTLLPHEVAAAATGRGATVLVAVPLLLRLLEPVVAASGLRAVYCGGAPLDPVLADRYAAAGVPVFAGYGLTEAAPTVSMNSPAHHRRGSVGRPLPGTEVRVDGPAGQPGEILVRSPGVMLGYWGDPAATVAAVDAGGWLHTGDIGRLDADGFLYVTGRAKRLVVLESGKKVQPEEVEAALADGDSFAEVCVVGAPAAAAGAEQVCAVVVPGPSLAARGLAPAELQAAAEAEVGRRVAPLSGYKRPTRVVVAAAPLPRTLKGSVRHDDVARMVAAR